MSTDASMTLSGSPYRMTLRLRALSNYRVDRGGFIVYLSERACSSLSENAPTSPPAHPALKGKKESYQRICGTKSSFGTSR